jgi:predicted metalloendopeptidase
MGYPDTWRDYSALTIDRGPYVLNVMRANRSRSADILRRSASRSTGPSGG